VVQSKYHQFSSIFSSHPKQLYFILREREKKILTFDKMLFLKKSVETQAAQLSRLANTQHKENEKKQVLLCDNNKSQI